MNKLNIPGQLSLFRVIWKHYPGCHKGFCSVCGNEVAYSSRPWSKYKGDYDIWVDNERMCSKCGAVFSEEDETFPDGLPVLSGLTDEPIVLTIRCTGYTEKDIKKKGGVEWLHHIRCTEWFDVRTTREIDDYIRQEEENDHDKNI